MATVKKAKAPKAEIGIEAAVHAPSRMPYADNDDDEREPAYQPIEGETEIPFGGTEPSDAVEAEAEAQADAAAAAEEKESKERTPFYHAVLRRGLVIQANTRKQFVAAISKYDADEILVMVRGKELVKKVQTVQTVTFE